MDDIEAVRCQESIQDLLGVVPDPSQRQPFELGLLYFLNPKRVRKS